MIDKPRIGLLPLYLEFYDRRLPEYRAGMEKFLGRIAGAFADCGVAVQVAPVCRLKKEVDAAVRALEKGGVDALVTLHLAYSPSLEAIDALARTRLPVIVLDTTRDFAFGPDQEPSLTMYNHGIHGVQDLCNLLIRRGKSFQIEVGHWTRSNVIDRVIGHLPAARMAGALRASRVGLIGRPFAGMGDFSVPATVLRRVIGTQIVQGAPPRMRRLVRGVSSKDVAREMAEDRRRFDTAGLDSGAHARSVRVGLAVRKWMAEERLSAVTMNFEAAGVASSGLPVMPFFEVSKAMACGMGYAGEGDVLTAALVGAVAQAYRDTTFTEMFCPDWKGGRIFLSHMGEFNPNLSERRPQLREPAANYTPGESSVVAYGRLRGGKALFVNIAPMADDKFRLIVAPVTMESVRGRDRFGQCVRGWFRPTMPVADFLGAYSRLGGTHHAVLAYGAEIEAMRSFACFAGLQEAVIA